MEQPAHPAFAGPGPDAEFAAALAQGRFRIQRCGACRRHVFYPRVLCPHCGAAGLGWVDAEGSGTLYSFTIVRRKAEHGGDYNVALVDLDEGPRLMSRVDGLAPEQLKIGMRLASRVIDTPRGKLLVFVQALEGTR